jgi:hypothetical protein
MTRPVSNLPPLAPDDPRISEWIDGRLPAGEAAEIERAVQDSPALRALVADLRAIKAAGRLVPAAAAPAGFAERVMARLGEPAADQTDPDQVVDDEWEAIEAERIAEERAEAAVDIEATGRRSRRRWPWLALAGALAAGVMATVVLNLPGDGRRDVALAPAPEAVQEVSRDKARVQAQAETARLAQDQTVAARQQAPTAPTARSPAVPSGSPAASHERMPQLKSAFDGLPGNPAPAAAAAPAAEFQTESLATPRLAEGLPGAGGGARVVAVTVRGPAGRAAFEQRAAALGVTLAEAGEGRGRSLDNRAAAEDRSVERARRSQPEVIAIFGPADAIEQLLAETLDDSQLGASPAAESGRKILREKAAVARVLVRLVELPDQARQQPAEAETIERGDSEP